MKVTTVFGLVALFIINTVSIVNSKALNWKIDDDWNLYKITFNKSYRDEREESFRWTVYVENKLEVDRHNQLYENGEVTFTLRMNHFGDLTREEYVGRLNRFKPSLDGIRTNHTFVNRKNRQFPKSIDWVANGAVTAVKNQLQCEASWAFSAVGALEGHHYMTSGELIPLSVQQVIDCNSTDDIGCYGGLPYQAFDYIIKNGGIETEQFYPYESSSGLTCRYRKDEFTVKMTGYERVETGDDDGLLAAVADFGPVSVTVDASARAFQLYGGGGVYTECGRGNSGSPAWGHPMLLVGYGTTDEHARQDFWTLKNSWGTDWGDQGYIRISRDPTNACGISDLAVYPTTRDDERSDQWRRI